MSWLEKTGMQATSISIAPEWFLAAVRDGADEAALKQMIRDSYSKLQPEKPEEALVEMTYDLYRTAYAL